MQSPVIVGMLFCLAGLCLGGAAACGIIVYILVGAPSDALHGSICNYGARLEQAYRERRPEGRLLVLRARLTVAGLVFLLAGVVILWVSAVLFHKAAGPA